MTLWGNRFGLILGLAFFTFACEDPGEIGLELNPENGAFVAKYTEIPMNSFIINYEDILSDNATRIDNKPRMDSTYQARVSDGRLLTGFYSTPDFGQFKSTAYTSLYLGLRGFNPAEKEFVFDSLVLSVKVDYLYGNNFSGIKRIHVHELTEEIKLDSIYLTRNSTPYATDPVGTFAINLSSFDSTRIDTVFTTRLSDELGLRLFDKAYTDTLTYSSNMEFRKFFNGFAFVADESNDVLTGIYAESQSTFARMYIHNATDTSSFDYILRGYNSKGDDISRYYNNISLNRAGTPIEGINGFYTDFQTDNGLTYIQGSSGIFTKLNLKSYINFLDTVKNLVINRAELVVPVESYTDYLVPSASLALYLTDQDNRFIQTYDSANYKIIFKTIGQIPYVKEKNENKGAFVGDVTNYIQNIASGTSSDTLLLLGPADLWNSVINVNQSISLKDKITLNIYYSSLQ